jgi:polar amino acid transport system substrate-binding protein
VRPDSHQCTDERTIVKPCARPRTSLRSLLAVVVTALVGFAVAACGSTPGSDENPYGLISPGSLRVAAVGDLRPYTYANMAGEFTGFDVELFTDVAHRIGIEDVNFAGQEFASVLPGVATGMFDVGVAAIGITEDRQRTVDFSDGYLAGYLTILGTKGGPVTSRDDLAGTRMGVSQGSLQELYAVENFPEADLVRFPEHNAGTAALRNGTIDTYFLDFESAKLYLGTTPDFTSIEDVPSFDAPAGFAVAKDRPELREALNRGLRDAMEDGTWKRLHEKYFPDTPMPAMYLPSDEQDATTNPDRR